MEVKVVNCSETLSLPSYATIGSAGLDLMACFDNKEMSSARIYHKTGEVEVRELSVDSVVTILPGERALIPTNIKTELPMERVLIAPSRSGLSVKKGIIIINSPGVIDEDYRGVIGLTPINLSNEPFSIKHGDALGQIILMKYEKVEWCEVEKLSETSRGAGGFGHTGINRS